MGICLVHTICSGVQMRGKIWDVRGWMSGLVYDDVFFLFMSVQSLKASMKVFYIGIPRPGKTTLAEAHENYCAIMTTESSMSIGI